MEEDSLVRRRSKRSTAGNRMGAALAEFHADELGQDAEEDVDFIVENDEQDAFGSDFESTDEEGAQEDVDAAAEKMVREEERKTKKVARSQLDKVTAAAHARQRATFHPDLTTDETSKSSAPPKPKRRVSLGVVVDAETGAIMHNGKRHSQRSYTMMSTSMADARFRDELEKKSTVPRKVKVKVPPPTQAELIARALDMEEGNIKEHKNYLTLEEEKRKKARLVRETVEGPLVRWISKAEKVKVSVEPPPTPAPAPTPTYTPPHPYGYAYYAHVPNAASSTVPYSAYATVPAAQPGVQGGPVPGTIYWPYMPQPPPAPPPAPEPIEEEHTECKNYVVHETDQGEGATRPLWKDTMAAMFGDHVKWEDMKVYTGKGRPLSRYVPQCPISGKPAKYMDPRTNVPYANIAAYDTLTKLLSREYVWSETLGCYTGTEGGTRAPPNMDIEGTHNGIRP